MNTNKIVYYIGPFLILLCLLFFSFFLVKNVEAYGCGGNFHCTTPGQVCRCSDGGGTGCVEGVVCGPNSSGSCTCGTECSGAVVNGGSCSGDDEGSCMSSPSCPDDCNDAVACTWDDPPPPAATDTPV